ncbi:hypothetical protein EDC04DRAFT_2594228 [Pisolithus marmoratus]|nr:hypothetical protein EDC04DRAFT_2594228 [Pisolithus marmoratus]
MWLISGPFDGELGNVSTTKTKLLRAGKKYHLGRKERQLIVNNKKISRDHCDFTVGPYTEDNQEDPCFVPRLEIYNAKEKAMSIDRGGDPFIVDPLSPYELRSGDTVNIVAGIAIQVEWKRIACFLPPARNLPSIPRQDCASIGISVVTRTHALATHHATSKYELTIPLATSLLSAAQLVKTEWLQECVRLGTVEDDTDSFKSTPLEQAFVLPLESKYRPTFSPGLSLAFKSFKFWEPNEERLNFLSGYRFVLLANENSEVDDDTRELCLRGGGEYDGFPLTSGHAKWRQMLAKAKRKMEEVGIKVIIITDDKAIQATVGSTKWQEMAADADSMSVPIIAVEALLNVVISIDVSVLLRTPNPHQDSSPPPVVNADTHPDEPCVGLVPSRQDVTGPNRQSSLPPAELEISILRSRTPQHTVETIVQPPPSRRVRTENRFTRNLSDLPSSNLFDPVFHRCVHSSFRLCVTSHLAKAHFANRPKLKRRAATPTTETVSVVDAILSEKETEREPPLKKFKALFDASDPDKMSADAPNNLDATNHRGNSTGGSQDTGTVTQSASLGVRGIAPHMRVLDAVVEEEEESIHARQLLSQSLLAAPAPNQLAVAQRAQPPTGQTSGELVATSNVDQGRVDTSQDQMPSKPKKSTGQLDTDQAFLTAVASKKRGKKGEDDFDREFNKLRISKPDIHREQEEDWAVLGDFDDDVRNIRGNFMVVVEMDVCGNARSREITAVRRDYEGKPNFKKFKKTPTPSSRYPVELVMKADDDYGVGPGYWKDSTAIKDSTLLPSQPGIQRRPRTILESEDEDTEELPVEKKRRKQPAALEGKSQTARLFLESDEESMQGKGSQKLTQGKVASSQGVHAGRMRSNKRHIIADDDSDEEVAFKGFGKKRRVR